MAPDPVRDEAERLVSAALAAVSLAARGFGGRSSSFATGSPECCVCPVCRVIAAMRDPNADIADRLATGAGDLAAGVASLLRSLSRPGPSGPGGSSEADAFWDGLRQRARADTDEPLREEDLELGDEDADNVWAAATRTPGAAEPAAPPAPVKKVVKKAVKKAAPTAAAVEEPPAPKKVAKKAVKKASGGSGAARAKASARKMAP